MTYFACILCSWDFIYAEYVMAAGHHHRKIVWQVISISYKLVSVFFFLFPIKYHVELIKKKKKSYESH